MRAVKNRIGKMRGFGCCPNCGDSYSWKPTGGLPFESEPTHVALAEEGIVLLNVGFERCLLLCIECRDKPAELNAGRIAVRLKKFGWKQDDIDRVRSAIANFQVP